MSDLFDRATSVFRDFNTVGDSLSGAYEPTKASARALLAVMTVWAEGWVSDIVNAPTGDEAEGARYIVSASPSGLFGPYADHIAIKIDDQWQFSMPPEGAQALLNRADSRLWQYSSGAWGQTTAATLGLGTAANHDEGDFALSSRTVTAGTGLSGGGTLTSDISLSADVKTVAGRTGDVVIATTDISGLGTASSHAASDFMQAANNLSEVASPATSRSNISAASSGANSDITDLKGLTKAARGSAPAYELPITDTSTGIVFEFNPATLAWVPVYGSLASAPSASALDAACASAGIEWRLDTNITLAANTTFAAKVVAAGGIITRGSYTLTFSLGFSAPKNMKCFDKAGTGLVTMPSTVTIYAAWFDMTMDGTTEDTTPLQQAINAGAAQTHFNQGTQHGNLVSIVLPQGKTVTSNITLPPMVRLIADGASEVGGYASSYPPTQITAKTGTTGFLIDTDDAIHNDGCGLVGIALYGLGAATALGGVRLRNTFRGCVSFCTVDNFADQAIYTSSNSKACTIKENLAQGCLLNRTRASATGVLHLDGSDHWALQGEYTDSASLTGNVSDANLYCAAVYVVGSTVFLNQVVGEISDVGFNIAGIRSQLLGCRSDNNYGHGFLISGDGVFAGCRSLSNGKGTANTYDGFHVTAGNSQFVGCFDDIASGSGGSIRYSFYDSQSSDSNKNSYPGCRGRGFTTAEFSFDAFAGASSEPRYSAFKGLTVNSASPAIDGNSSWKTANTSATAYTDFTGGRSGQILIVQCQDANSSLTNSGNIRTFSGATETMINNRLYFLYNYNGKWWEMGFNAKMADISALTISAGTPGLTISDVGAAFSQTTLNNNFASVGTQINAIRTALRGAGLMA